MKYEFGDYEVQVSRRRSLLTDLGSFSGKLFYKNNLIDELAWSSKERFVLRWAEKEIEAHKLMISRLNKFKNV